MVNSDNNSAEEIKLPAEENKNGIRNFVDSLVIAFVIAMIIRTFVISAYRIPSGSMLDTLDIGDHILASKVHYLIGTPKHDDIAVFEYPMEPHMDFIKRVLGVPGDRIKIVNKVIYRNGEAVDEPYIPQYRQNSFDDPVVDNVEEFVVPEGMYLMIGDNRDNSFDGRYWGFVPEKSFKGKALVIYWSKEPSGPIKWDRLFNIIK